MNACRSVVSGVDVQYGQSYGCCTGALIRALGILICIDVECEHYMDATNEYDLK